MWGDCCSICWLQSEDAFLKIIAKKKFKCISTGTLRKKLTQQNYVSCLLEQSTNNQIQKGILLEKHNLYTVKQNKKCLSLFDYKRFLLSHRVSSLAYGHCDIALDRLDNE